MSGFLEAAHSRRDLSWSEMFRSMTGRVRCYWGWKASGVSTFDDGASVLHEPIRRLIVGRIDSGKEWVVAGPGDRQHSIDILLLDAPL
jgi:hypothetical protein